VAYDYFTISALATEMEATIGNEICGVEGDPRHNADVDPPPQPCALFIALRPPQNKPITATLTNQFEVEALHLDGAHAFHAARDQARASHAATGASDGERYLRGATIVAVEADRRERQISLRLRRRGPDGGGESFGRLIFELVHRRFQTILMAERSERVIWIWSLSRLRQSRRPAGDQRVRVGQPYVPAPNTRLLPGEDEASSFINRMRSEEQAESLLRAATRHLCGADRHVSTELLQRAHLSSEQGIGECSDDDLHRFWQQAVSMFTSGCGAGSVTWAEAGEAQFSALAPGRQVTDLSRHTTISEGITHWFRILETRAVPAGSEGQHGALKAMRKRLRALERKRQALQADMDETHDAEECAKKGAVLLAQANNISPGSDQVELEDPFDADGNARILIELDPLRSIADMGGSYLKRAAKLRKRAAVLPSHLSRLESEIARLRQLAGDCAEGDLPQDQIDHLIRELAPLDHKDRRDKEPQARPRRYRTSAGWIVWAGRNNRENDVLTHRLAAPEDIWFHAHGYAGSHVVLRREGRKEQPSARTVEEAAAVAAYWSKGKTANKVSVSYTAAKHVRKPRGSAPGLAVLSREKTILVRPMLLPEEDQPVQGQ
jgi:predicted ribosome quality control (RQC) complex YloA/Tae2 family protein